MKELVKGKEVIITIRTVLDEVEDFSEFNPNEFNQNPFVYIKYANGFSLELPRFSAPNTEITVEEPQTASEDSGSDD